MLKQLSGLLFLVLFTFSLLAQTDLVVDTADYDIYELDGTYQGKDLIIQNPYMVLLQSNIVKKIVINDNMDIKQVDQPKILISLANFTMGENINIKIYHVKKFLPKITDPSFIESPSTFEIVSNKVDDKFIRWTTNNETNHEPFFIEQFRFQKWVTIGKVIGLGGQTNNSYQYPVIHHSGINLYRIKQKDIKKGFVYSKQVEYDSKQPPVTYQIAGNEIYFSSLTFYEIFELNGTVVSKGRGTRVSISELQPITYYMNLDDRLEILNFGVEEENTPQESAPQDTTE